MAHSTPVLVVGADGVLGAAVAACLAEIGAQVMGTSRRGTPGLIPLDLTASSSQWNIPTAVKATVICAGITSTSECRMHPDHARRVNVDATLELAARLISAGSRVVFPSSNQVFDGTVAFAVADTVRCPLTAYGRMKAETEAAILGLGDKVLVARLTKIVHRDMPLFMSWRNALQRGQVIQPFNDLPFAPVTPGFAAKAIAAALEHELAGILQVSAAADLTYADVALRLARVIGLPASLIQPVSATTAHAIEHVPCYTTLDTSTLRDRLGLPAPDPWVALEALIH